MKTILRVKTSTPNDLVYAELGRQTLRTKRLVQKVNYWFKILTSQDTKYIKHVYNFVLQDIEAHPNKVIWAVLVRNLLSELSFYKVLVQQGVENFNAFISLFKQRLTDNIMFKTLMPDYKHTAELVFFNLFGSFQFHDYLNLVRIPKYKYSLIKLRPSSHRLAVEIGRWNKPHPIPLEERKCRFCTSLEDEFHFLFECKLHDGLRKTYISRYCWNRPNIPKLIELFNSNNKKSLTNLGIYIDKAFKFRSEQVISNKVILIGYKQS